MENEQDRIGERGDGTDAASPAVTGSSSTRRRFGKQAVGAAVLLTVGNRVAWGSDRFQGGGKYDGKGKTEKACISQRAWHSYKTGEPSHFKGGKYGKGDSKFYQELADFEEFLDKGDYTLYQKDDGFLQGRQVCAVRETRDDDNNWWNRDR